MVSEKGSTLGHFEHFDLWVYCACHFERSEKSGSLFSIDFNELLRTSSARNPMRRESRGISMSHATRSFALLRMTCCPKLDFSLQSKWQIHRIRLFTRLSIPAFARGNRGILADRHGHETKNTLMPIHQWVSKSRIITGGGYGYWSNGYWDHIYQYESKDKKEDQTGHRSHRQSQGTGRQGGSSCGERP